MQHTVRFRACDDGRVLLDEPTLAYGLASGYERGAAELGVLVGRRVRMELLDDTGRLLDWRTYVVPMAGGRFPTLIPGRTVCQRPGPALTIPEASGAFRRSSA